MALNSNYRKAFIGERIELKSTNIPGLWVCPRKLSIDAADEMRVLSLASLPVGEPEKMRGLQDLEKRLKQEKKTLKDADPFELIPFMASGDKERRSRMIEISLLHGIGEHNLTDDGGKILCGGNRLDAEIVKEIIEDAAPLAEEMFTIIQQFNAPLPKGSAQKSQMSPNGDTKGSDSNQAASSPTGTTPGS